MNQKRSNKGRSTRTKIGTVWKDRDFYVISGELRRGRGRPAGKQHLFTVVAEKLPFACLSAVQKVLTDNDFTTNGVYMAHDSMGVARYGGRGHIFPRLRSRKRRYPKELLYFSFYIIEQKNHEREIETAILRAASSQMVLNVRKVRAGNQPGGVSDYEPGTYFFQRFQRTGKKKRLHDTR